MNKNTPTIGLLREFLKFFSLTMLAYGIGKGELWQEVTGGIMALAMLVIGIRANAGRDKLSSLLRTAIQAAAAILVTSNVLTQDKAEPIIGMVMVLSSMAWSTWEKSNKPIPPAVPVVMAILCLLSTSCNLPIRVATPYGTLQTDAKGGLAVSSRYADVTRAPDGSVVILPKPIIIPQK